MAASARAPPRVAQGPVVALADVAISARVHVASAIAQSYKCHCAITETRSAITQMPLRNDRNQEAPSGRAAAARC